MAKLSDEDILRLKQTVTDLVGHAAVLELKLDALRSEFHGEDFTKDAYGDHYDLLKQEIKTLVWQINGLNHDLERILTWRREVVGGDVYDEQYWMWESRWVTDKRAEAFEKVKNRLFKEIVGMEIQFETLKKAFEKLEEIEKDDFESRKAGLMELRETHPDLDPVKHLTTLNVRRLAEEFKILKFQNMDLIRRELQAMEYLDPASTSTYGDMLKKLKNMEWAIINWLDDILKKSLKSESL